MQANNVILSLPRRIRIVINSASTESDRIADWSFTSLLGQVLPSFDGSSLNDMDQVDVCPRLSARRLSDIQQSESAEETQLNHASEYHCYHYDISLIYACFPSVEYIRAIL